MKINFKQIYFLLFAVIFSVWALMVIYSCSDSRQAQKGWDKFTKNGGKVQCDTTYIDVPRIVKGKDGKDSLIYVPTPCNCPGVEMPESRLEIRWKYKYDLKRQKERDAFLIDSLENDRKLKVKLGRTNKKVVKSNNSVVKNKDDNNTKENTANNRSWNITWIVIGLVTLIFLTFKYVIPK